MLTKSSPNSRPHAAQLGHRPWLVVFLCLAPLGACTPRQLETAPTVAAPAIAAPISQIQGAGHRSPMLGQRVETRGVVTARSAEMLFLQGSGDGDLATSDGLCVLPREDRQLEFMPGQELEVTGRVEEWQRRDNDLTITCLRFERATVLAESVEPPAAVRLGRGGRLIPHETADDDGLRDFEPAADGVDFFETLEGMRVEVRDALVVGATSRRGEVIVVADRGVDASQIHPRGGLLRRQGDANPEALMLSGEFGVEAPVVDVGQRLEAIDAVLDYGWGAYRLRLLAAPRVSGSAAPREQTRLRQSAEHLTVASFNVLNLAATDPPGKFRDIADIIVHSLAAPDILGLQEIQDDSGSLNDGTTTAQRTYETLIEAIEAAGGPRYAGLQLDPVDLADGGQPGGNIRVGFLFRPDRVDAIDSAKAAPEVSDGASLAAPPTFVKEHDRVALTPNPARLTGPAFDLSADGTWRGTRKPLVAQFRFRGRDLFFINLHLRSKGGDDRAFGDVQPPIRHTEPQRTAQAQAVRDLAAQLLDADPDAWLIVLGDFNEHIDRPPVRSFEGLLINMLEKVPEPERYTYVFRGQAQILDHMLVSPAVDEHGAPEIDIVHTASDYASVHQASDHEPLVLRVRVSEWKN